MPAYSRRAASKDERGAMRKEEERYNEPKDYSFVEEPFWSAIAEYIQQCDMHLSPWTGYAYRKELKQFFEWAKKQNIQLNQFTDLTKEVIAEYQKHLFTAEKRHGGKLTLSSQRKRLGAVKRFCEYLTEQEKILIDPAASIHLPKEGKQLPRNYLSHREVRKLLSAADLTTHIGVRNRAILEIFYATGIRNSELRNLKIRDIDLKEGWLRIHGKGDKERIVPIGKAAIHFLSAWINLCRPVLTEKKPSDYLFVSKQGGKLHQQTPEDIVEALAKKAKLKTHITPHGLRHSCATAMLRGRAGIRYIQELLGHASLSSTEIYTRVEIADLKKVHSRCHPREKEAIDRR